MTGFRCKLPSEFIKDIVSIFLSKPNMSILQEIHINRLNTRNIVLNMISRFPTLQMYYFPSKLNNLLLWKYNKETKQNEFTIPFDSCVKILRQVLRAGNFKVQTRTFRKNNIIEKVIIIIPPK